jgi:CheY-like chemotaxis protein
MRNILRSALGETIVIETRLAETLWRTSADVGQIEGALLNLALNSRDAMLEGGSITLRTSNVTLDADRLAHHADVVPGDFVMLEVADTGTGMTAEQSEHAFEPFYTTKGVGEGTGLGLSVVYGFGKQSGGFVEIDSEVGCGTSVRLCLPRAEQQDGEAELEKREHAEPVDGDGTILVVEDDPDVRALAVSLLSELGYDIVEAEDGHAALARLDERPDIELLFTDVVLPGGMNGHDIAREGRLRRPGLKVLFTSGYPDAGDGDQPVDDAISEFVRKPYRKSELAKKLAAVLHM